MNKQILCPTCNQENDQDVDFCVHCGAPVGFISTIDPIKQIRAQGFMYRRVTRPDRFILYVGAWILFGIPLFSFVFFLVHGGILLKGLSALAVFFLGRVLYRAHKYYFKAKRNRKNS